MRSFAFISAAAAVVFGAVASAMPLLNAGAATGAVAEVGNIVHAGAGAVALVHARDVEVVGVATVMATLKANVGVVVDAMTFITPNNCTKEAIAPLVANIHGSIQVAISGVQALAGKEAAVILAGVDGKILTEAQLIVIVSDVICVILNALAVVIKVAGINLSVVLSLLAAVVVDISALLTVVVNVCAVVVVGIGASIYANISVALGLVVALGVSPIHIALGL